MLKTISLSVRHFGVSNVTLEVEINIKLFCEGILMKGDADQLYNHNKMHQITSQLEKAFLSLLFYSGEFEIAYIILGVE